MKRHNFSGPDGDWATPAMKPIIDPRDGDIEDDAFEHEAAFAVLARRQPARRDQPPEARGRMGAADRTARRSCARGWRPWWCPLAGQRRRVAGFHDPDGDLVRRPSSVLVSFAVVRLGVRCCSALRTRASGRSMRWAFSPSNRGPRRVSAVRRGKCCRRARARRGERPSAPPAPRHVGRSARSRSASSRSPGRFALDRQLLRDLPRRISLIRSALANGVVLVALVFWPSPRLCGGSPTRRWQQPRELRRIRHVAARRPGLARRASVGPPFRRRAVTASGSSAADPDRRATGECRRVLARLDALHAKKPLDLVADQRRLDRRRHLGGMGRVPRCARALS